MSKPAVMMAVLCAFGLWTNNACGLEIQLSPQTLVLSSGGDQLTIHTDFPWSEDVGIQLNIGETTVDEESVSDWADDCGRLVVRCSKDDVKDAVGDFATQFTTVEVTLSVWSDDDTGSATRVLRVRK